MAIVRLVSGAGFTSDVIKWYTSSPFSHVEFYTPLGFLGSQAPGGVRLRPFNYCTYNSVEFREYVLPPEVDEALIAWVSSQIGKGYDWTAIIALPLHRNWRDPSDWYCSELVAAAFDHVGYPLFAHPAEVSKITPRDVALSPLLVACPAPPATL